MDLRGYRLVFKDDFNEAELDTTKWAYRGSGPRRAGYNSKSQVRLENGNLILSANYLEEGEFGPGWYSGMISIRQRFTGGYFEARCVCSRVIPPDSFWSAFWIQARNPYDAAVSKGGVGGAEIDIFEGVCVDGKDGIEQNIHCKGVKGSRSGPGQTDHLSLGKFFPQGVCSEFNTYGLLWNESEYVFYINGEEVSRTSYGDGVSQVDEEVILSLEIPSKIPFDREYKTEFLTDYVRVYQKI